MLNNLFNNKRNVLKKERNDSRLDTEMEKDEARSEATFRFTVQDFSSLEEEEEIVISPPWYVRNLPWKINVWPVMPRQTPSTKTLQQKTLGFYLQCNGESESSTWSCLAKAELRLISHKPGKKPYSRNFQRLYNREHSRWGFPNFMVWNDILDPEKGYIKDDSITLEVHITAKGLSWDSKKHTDDMEVINGWQHRFKQWKERLGPQLRSGHLADCTFQVGAEPHQVMISAHKLILGAASPVFETMFYGKMAETSDYIRIPDIQPNTFKALLEFIYTNDVKLNTFELACDLYYGAKKYMLPDLLQKCSEYLVSVVDKYNACRAYEFALIFEDDDLIDECIETIGSCTTEVLKEGDFEEIELNTVLTILSIEHLNINSELELFLAVERYAKAQKEKFLESNMTPSNYGLPKENENTPATVAKEINGVVDDDDDLDDEDTITDESCNAVEPNKPTPGPTGDDGKRGEDAKSVPIRRALKMIRFLAMTPKEFAEGPAKSPLLKKSEVFAVLMNLSSTETAVPMPSGWSTCRQPRQRC